MKRKLLIATHNKGKLQLFKNYLASLDYDILSLDDVGITYDVEETGLTYEENARKKAEAYAELSGLLTLADDGGLEIDALGGEPGIYSARYAGEDKTDAQKVAFVLDKLKGVAENDRAARFVVVLALAQPGKEIKFFQGELEGSLSLEPRGTPHKQLPYRQLFIPEGYSYTLDELDDRGISYVSHRQKAVNKVVQALKD